MPDSSGFGSYTESGLVIPARFRGEDVSFVSQMYLDDDPPIAAGREIWGFPKKYAHPKLEIAKDTLTGTLRYAGELVAMGTMTYKHEAMAGGADAASGGADARPRSTSSSSPASTASRRSASSSPSISPRSP